MCVEHPEEEAIGLSQEGLDVFFPYRFKPETPMKDQSSSKDGAPRDRHVAGTTTI